jgi:predicted nucleic acid-binding protein
MIVIDSSVWIDHLNDDITQQVSLLRVLVGREPILVGDLILCEVLQGLRTDAETRKVEAALRRFTVATMLTPDSAPRVAANYRRLRAGGITVAKTIDVIIATFCVENGLLLLHDDEDYRRMEEPLGLRLL